MSPVWNTLVSSLESSVPHGLYAALGPSAVRTVVFGYVALFYVYLFSALWIMFRRLLGERAGWTPLLLCLAGCGITLSAPALMVLGTPIEPQFAGAWQVAALVPLLMAAARWTARPEASADADETPAVPAPSVSDREKLMSMLSQTSDGVLTVNSGGRIEMMNAAAEKLLGVAAKEWIGSTLEQFAAKVPFHTTDRTPIPVEAWPVMRTLREGTIANEIDVQLYPTPSKRVFLRVSASPLRGAQGRIDTVVCVIKDRTAQHQLEILKEELFASPAVPSEKNPSIETLRAPAPAPAASVPAPQPAVPAAQLAAPASFAPAPFLKTFMWDMSGEGTRMGVTLTDQIPSVLPNVIAPMDVVRAALAKLLEYALRTTMAGGMVKVSASADESGVVFSVRDGGMGMIPEEVSRFSSQFESLSSRKGDQTRNPLYPLIIAKETLEPLGVTLDVRSEGLKKGTSYVFRLPAAAPTPPVSWDNQTARSIQKDEQA